MYKKLYNRTMDEKIRINKYLSEAGICSRREADRMIEEGRITVNGKKAESGQKVSLEDEVCADNDADGVAGWLEQHILNAAKEA